MIKGETIRKKIIEYLLAKGYPKERIKFDYKVPYLELGKTDAVACFDIVVLDEKEAIQEFYEIKTAGITSADIKRHNDKYTECKNQLEFDSMIAQGALGYLVVYDMKKRDFELYLISEEINSLSSFVDVVLRVANTKSGYTNYYRGQGNIEFSLLPGLYRKTTTPAKETSLYKEAIRRCPDDFNGLTTTFQHLVKLQHYGIPTRLLDLTSNAQIALFFAVEKKEYSLKNKKKLMDGVVFVFSVEDKSIKSYDSDTVSVLSNLARVPSFSMPKAIIDKDVFNKLDDTELLLHEIKYEKPHFQHVINQQDMLSTFCVKPKLDNSRIRQQSGAFFLYGIGSNKNTCSTLAERPISIVIDSRYKDRLKRELACFGISDAYVYPEMDHVMKNIKEDFKV